MKTFTLFLLSFVVVTAMPTTPSSSDEQRLQSLILKEIIESVKDLDDILNDTVKKTFVQEVITDRHCNVQSICKAGKALETFKAGDLGIQEKQWLLPRRLVAYSRSIQCKEPTSHQSIELQRLLHNIKECAQKMYSMSYIY
ncbi:hypothetical protein NFI96_033734 [Prochilodus magdalenae]|nr:hypothetical protein NFI96_033734 [Prochilodus magdalenae]